MTMTDWFPPDIKPVREGEYSVADDRWDDMYRWWDGERWSLAYRTIHIKTSKVRFRNIPAPFFVQNAVRWRGLATDPNRRGAV